MEKHDDGSVYPVRAIDPAYLRDGTPVRVLLTKEGARKLGQREWLFDAVLRHGPHGPCLESIYESWGERRYAGGYLPIHGEDACAIIVVVLP
jgi:hypothetical protein